MSLEQIKSYLKTEEAKKDIVEKAREAGFEVSEEDLAEVSGGGIPDQVLELLNTQQEGNSHAKAGVKL